MLGVRTASPGGIQERYDEDAPHVGIAWLGGSLRCSHGSFPRPPRTTSLRPLRSTSRTSAARRRSCASQEFELDGVKLYCGTRPTVIDNKLDDYGAAYPGFLIMNLKLLSRVSTPVKLWIYSHECGHQFRGPDEESADCFAVQRGRRMGWLSPGGVEEICQFITPAKGDAMHFSGSHRCEYMRQCFNDFSVR